MLYYNVGIMKKGLEKLKISICQHELFDSANDLQKTLDGKISNAHDGNEFFRFASSLDTINYFTKKWWRLENILECVVF